MILFSLLSMETFVRAPSCFPEKGMQKAPSKKINLGVYVVWLPFATARPLILLCLYLAKGNIEDNSIDRNLWVPA